METVVATRSQQVIGLLLNTIPLAERMLLYNLALAAWVMVPNRANLFRN